MDFLIGDPIRLLDAVSLDNGTKNLEPGLLGDVIDKGDYLLKVSVNGYAFWLFPNDIEIYRQIDLF